MDYVSKCFKDLTLSQMDNMLARLASIRDAKLFISRNYATKDEECIITITDFIWAKQFKLIIQKLKNYYRLIRNVYIRGPKTKLCYLTPTNPYVQPRRGDLILLCNKYNLQMNEMSRGRTWIYLRVVIVNWYLNHKKIKGLKATHLEYNDQPYGFSTHNTEFVKFLNTLASVCKEWRIVLKSMCIWWGPGSREFAFIKGTMDPRVTAYGDLIDLRHANDYNSNNGLTARHILNYRADRIYY